mmetsp:Transcript_3778/g.10614  ORF Transcript_3778/g.10614 Transcript_3778/m.10614 type:complete len:547 (+) Transcript_3778:151-1791(+)
MAEISKGFKLLSLLDEHGKDRLQRGFQIVGMHLGQERVGSSCEDRTSAEPDLVILGSVADEGELGHVRTSAAVGAARHADHDLLVAEVHLVQDVADSLQVAWHDALSLGLCQSAQRQGGTCHGQTVQRVDGFDRQDAVLGEEGVDGLLVLGVDVADDDGLGRAEDHGDVVFVDQRAQGGLQSEAAFVLDAAALGMESVKELAVALLPPAHPVAVLPLLDRSPRLDLVSVVALHEGAEVVDAEGVHKVLHAGVGAHVAVSVIALGGDDALHDLHDVLLGDEAQVVGSAREGVFLVVGAAHAASNHDVETFQLSLVVGDDDAADVVGVNVDGVVAWDGDADLELSWQVPVTVNWFDGMVEDDAAAVVVLHDLVDVVVRDLLVPRFDACRLLAVQPDLRKCWRHWAEELGKDLAVLAGVFVIGRRERRGSRHDVTADITAGSDGGRSDVHDGPDDSLQAPLQDAVHLEALARGGSEIALSVLPGKIVQQTVEIGRQFAGRLLQSEHELEVLLAPNLAVGLLVGSVVLEDLVGILGDSNLFGFELLIEWM